MNYEPEDNLLLCYGFVTVEVKTRLHDDGVIWKWKCKLEFVTIHYRFRNVYMIPVLFVNPGFH